VEADPAYPAPVQSIFAENPVIFVADDGLELVGTFSAPDAPSPWPTVILLHMLGGRRSDYDGQIARFTGEGYAVLALDMRGHGDTGGAADWDLVAGDLKMVAENLLNRPEIKADGLAILGASIGSNMALKTGAAVPAVRSVVLLSPGLDYRGVTTADVLADYGDRPILIVASSEDSYSAESSQTLADSATGLVNFKLYEGAGHGTRMFAAEPGLMDLILAHLNQYVR
jgi:dienelactone hydrolase